MMRLLLILCCVYLINHAAIAQNDVLTYEYSVPYSGGATLTIYNNGDIPVTLTAIHFKCNALLKDKPYGDLFGWQSVLNRSINPDGIHMDYTINEKPFVIINAKSHSYLTYHVPPSSLLGPLSPYNLAMDPIDVSVTVMNANTPIALKIKDACQGHACIEPGRGKRMMGYYPNWAYWRVPPFKADKLPFDKINTVGYAFFIFDQQGNVSLNDKESDEVNIPIISQARKRYPYLNASLTFGGWSWMSTPPGWGCAVGVSPNGPAACFSQMTANPVAMAHFVKNAVLAMKEVQFNGIDIDWEYPTSIDDVNNYLSLMQALRLALNEQAKLDHKTYYLTTAVAPGINKINVLTPLQWQKIAEAVDYLDVMTYDFHGDWDAGHVGSDFMSAMQLDPMNDSTVKDPVLSKYNVVDAMNAYLERGVPANKLVLGIPLYGRMVQITTHGKTFGLYQPIIGVPQGEWDNQQSGLTGLVDYQCIVDHSTCKNQYTMPNLFLMNPEEQPLGQYALTPWGYSNDFFITYDDAASAKYKAQWVARHQFGGIFLWDLTGDFDDKDARSIVNVIDKTFDLDK